MKSKEEYINDLSDQLKQWAGKIDELKVQATLAKAEAKDELEKRMRELREMQSGAQKKLEELKSSSGEAWEGLKGGTEKAWSEMKHAVDNAIAKFKK